MKREDKAAYDKYVVFAAGVAKATYKSKGYTNFEDMSQEVALLLSSERIKISGSGKDWVLVAPYAAERFVREVAASERSRQRGLKLMDIDNAMSIPDMATPHHFIMAKEIAEKAVGLDLDSIMMGDTLEDEAAHYGVTRQRAHQIVTGLRDQMAEYLIP